ncbi:MAG: proton-conducting membrane transporter [Oscillospiraceae bacterium]|nr:proton-conducting membrane transporter [Oscillospiraceae bacterium]
MMTNRFLILVPILFPLLCGLAVAFAPALQAGSRRRPFVLFSLGGTFLSTICVLLLLRGHSLHLCDLAPSIELRFAVDEITCFFAGLGSFMWLMSGIFSMEYMQHETNHTRFYAFFLMGEASMLGVTLSANYPTLYLCFEWMTLLTLPLVFHIQSEESIQAGIKYLLYSFAGAFAGLMGIPFLAKYGTTLNFVHGGVLDPLLTEGHEGLLLAVAFAAILGFGAKTGLFPLHAWLPAAHPVAPAPASALLSGVVTKAGVIAILRVIYYLFGAQFLAGTWVQTALLTISLLTVFMGSSMAFRENIFKKRLAYSTVSQVSYILFGIFLMNDTALEGSLLHVLCHSLAKGGIFLCAGTIIYKTDKTDVRQLRGIGKEMPVVLWCFTLCSLALVGIPPMSGFMSKWYLALGSLENGFPVISWLGPVILLISAILTAGYLLPITIHGFFPGADFDYSTLVKKDPTLWILVPLLILTTLAAFTLFPQPFMALVENTTEAIIGGMLS